MNESRFDAKLDTAGKQEQARLAKMLGKSFDPGYYGAGVPQGSTLGEAKPTRHIGRIHGRREGNNDTNLSDN